MNKRNLTGFIGFSSSLRYYLRTYVHRFGLNLYDQREADAVIRAIDYARCTLAANHTIMSHDSRGDSGVIAFAWARGNERVVDFFKMTYEKNWPSNPAGKAFVFKDGVYQPDFEFDTCGDGFIVLGEEEKFRRTTAKKHEYFTSPSPIRIAHNFTQQ
jgi:hypothetical protein